jgi:hypothetical protein
LASVGVRALGYHPTARQFGFANRLAGRIVRHLLPLLHAMNFVLDDVLDGGVNGSLNLDGHGKALSFLLLELPLRVPRTLLPLLAGPPLDR